MFICPTCGATYSVNESHCANDGSKLISKETQETIIDGRYQLLDSLGVGTVGAVYKAEHLWMKKTVAIKLLKPEVTSSEEAIKRFTREARLASLIENPHCVIVHDFARAPDETFYLVMEYLEGQSLFALLRQKKRLSLEESREIFLQILEALGAAHQLGIIHRDVKPENVMLLERGSEFPFAKILDFGIAKSQLGSEGGASQLTRAGLTVGTPEYIAPEQATALSVDCRADLYATGVMLFECVTGKRPFRGKTAVEIVTAHVHSPPPRPRDIAPDAGVSEALERVILKALSKDPNDRYPDASSFAKALKEAIPKGGSLPKAPPPRSEEPEEGIGAFLRPLFGASFWKNLGETWRSPAQLGRLFGLFGVVCFLLSLLFRIL